MAEANIPKQEAPKQEASKQEAPKQEAPKQEAPKRGKVAHPAPSQFEGLDKGEDGRPATIDNPPAEKRSK